MGIQAVNLPAVTSTPTSVNLLGTYRLGGIEKSVKFSGLNLSQLNTSVDTAGLSTRVDAVVSEVSAYRLDTTSVITEVQLSVSRIQTCVASDIARLSAVSGALGSDITALEASVSNLKLRVAAISALAAAP